MNSAQVRSREEIDRFVGSLEVLEPGLVPAHRWQPDSDVGDLDGAAVSCLGVVARVR
jgi:hypothetical protein